MAAGSESWHDSLPQPVFPPTGTKEGLKSPHLLADGFASIAFGYPQTHFWGEPQTPEATKMLQFSQICAPSIDRLVNSVLS